MAKNNKFIIEIFWATRFKKDSNIISIIIIFFACWNKYSYFQFGKMLLKKVWFKMNKGPSLVRSKLFLTQAQRIFFWSNRLKIANFGLFREKFSTEVWPRFLCDSSGQKLSNQQHGHKILDPNPFWFLLTRLLQTCSSSSLKGSPESNPYPN